VWEGSLSLRIKIRAISETLHQPSFPTLPFSSARSPDGIYCHRLLVCILACQGYVALTIPTSIRPPHCPSVSFCQCLSCQCDFHCFSGITERILGRCVGRFVIFVHRNSETLRQPSFLPLPFCPAHSPDGIYCHQLLVSILACQESVALTTPASLHLPHRLSFTDISALISWSQTCWHSQTS
jgi:hypothetical protein